ncbi:hypothetical protein BH20ACT9_BH20ACT9_04800 [soil metagenome]
MPHHTAVTLHEAGHYLQSDAPQEFAEAVRGWHKTRSAPLPPDHPGTHR